MFWFAGLIFRNIGNLFRFGLFVFYFLLKFVLVCFRSNPLVGGSGAWNCCLPTVKLQMGLVANKIIRDKIENYRNTKRKILMKTLPKAQWAQGIECFDSFNILSSNQKLRQALKSWSNLILFGKQRKMHRTILTNPYNNFNISF